MKKLASILSILLFLNSIISCQKSSINKSFFEDLTAEEVLKIQETTQSFKFFYDNIRPRIIRGCDDYDKVEYAEVTYKSMYDMFKYWESSELKQIITDYISAYTDEIKNYQVQIDSISDSYRTYIDKFKVKGAPDFDYTRIFEHPPLYHIYPGSSYPYGVTEVNFTLPIKSHELFNEIGITKLSFRITLTDKKSPGHKVFQQTFSGNHPCFGKFTMNLYDGSIWSLYDPKYHYDARFPVDCEGFELAGIEQFISSYNKRLSPRDNFTNAFDWYYEVIEGPSYRKFLLNKIPMTVFSYWESQEGSSLPNYVNARNNMIKEFCKKDFSPLYNALPIAIENNIRVNYPLESCLYDKAKTDSEAATRKFESMFNIYPYDGSDWVSPDLKLPISHSNGNYVRVTQFDKRIPRDPTIILSN